MNNDLKYFIHAGKVLTWQSEGGGGSPLKNYKKYESIIYYKKLNSKIIAILIKAGNSSIPKHRKERLNINVKLIIKYSSTAV